MTEVIPSDAKNILGFGNRESLDIIDLILLVCLSGTMKTHVMYKCNLNSRQVQDYLELLLKFQLLEKRETEEKRTDLPDYRAWQEVHQGLRRALRDIRPSSRESKT